jgi:hypothetical protein
MGKLRQLAPPAAWILTALRRSDFNARRTGDAAMAGDVANPMAISHLIKHDDVTQSPQKGQGRIEVSSTL